MASIESQIPRSVVARQKVVYTCPGAQAFTHTSEELPEALETFQTRCHNGGREQCPRFCAVYKALQDVPPSYWEP
jgi:hypothetical protein